MSFEKIDKFIDDIKLKHTFEYLCSSQYPAMEIPDITKPVCDVRCWSRLENQENRKFNMIQSDGNITNNNINGLQNKMSKIQKIIEDIDIIECPICLNHCVDYVRPKCNHKICINCFVRNNNTIYGNKCCMCRKKIYDIN